MEELIKAMSNEDLAGLRDKYADNASVVLLIDGILETRGREVVQAEAKVKFEGSIAKMVAKLPRPEDVPDVHNIYIHPGEVEVEVGEPEQIEVVDGEGNKTIETRVPKVKVNQWIVEVNHATKVVGSDGGTSPKTSKRAITVYKRHGTALEPQGNFASASKACEHLNLNTGGDSAMRVLARDGYITEAYNGTDFQS